MFLCTTYSSTYYYTTFILYVHRFDSNLNLIVLSVSVFRGKEVSQKMHLANIFTAIKSHKTVKVKECAFNDNALIKYLISV